MLLNAQGGGFFDPLFLITMTIVIGIFYFFMVRPQAQKQKAETDFRDNLQKGDEVVTASGIIGKINKIDDKFVTLEAGKNTYIRMTRTAISREMTDSLNADSDEDKKS